MDQTKFFVREKGYVTTIFGRKCHYPRVTASNPSERAFNERAAINAPIQGSAADIIRRGMVRMDEALARAKLSAKMLLQVHDELVFEVPDAEAARVLGFLGSPTVRVDGLDVEPASRNAQGSGFACRRYPEGLPSAEMIRAALREAKGREE